MHNACEALLECALHVHKKTGPAEGNELAELGLVRYRAQEARTKRLELNWREEVLLVENLQHFVGNLYENAEGSRGQERLGALGALLGG